MKYIALFLLSSVAVGLVMAFPDNHNAVADLSDGGVYVNAISNSGAADASAASETTRLREPRHLLKKLFSPPEVVVQPIVVQPQQPYYTGYNPYAGAGRGYGGYGGFAYNRPIGY
ncbi:uncharacterized protein LOC117784983 [Drosophila innubila]|uniref:uncharacterized protein LOC117784983 n=1 Tax=Drosophila innubila TaxID=198719 RepID=UPI00148CA2CF|nr:uncharacterized protein LOC117784983 [Drosophila innubila]